MKKINYEPSMSDVKTMLTTLTIMIEILPTLELDGFDELHKQQNIYYANAAFQRLEKLDTKISINELHAIYNSLVIADMINHKELNVDDAIAKHCLDHIFVIQKLLPVLDKFFDD